MQSTNPTRLQFFIQLQRARLQRLLSSAAKMAPIVKALCAGKQLEIYVNVRNEYSTKPELTTLKVRTSRHGRSKWSHVSMQVPDGEYMAILRRKV